MSATSPIQDVSQRIWTIRTQAKFLQTEPVWARPLQDFVTKLDTVKLETERPETLRQTVWDIIQMLPDENPALPQLKESLEELGYWQHLTDLDRKFRDSPFINDETFPQRTQRNLCGAGAICLAIFTLRLGDTPMYQLAAWLGFAGLIIAGVSAVGFHFLGRYVFEGARANEAELKRFENLRLQHVKRKLEATLLNLANALHDKAQAALDQLQKNVPKPAPVPRITCTKLKIKDYSSNWTTQQ